MVNPATKMKASGILPHIVLSKRLKEVEIKLDNLGQVIMDLLKQIKDDVVATLKNTTHTQPSTATLESICSRIIEEIKMQQSINNVDKHGDQTETTVVEELTELRCTAISCPTMKLFDAWNMWWSNMDQRGQPMPLCLVRSRDFDRQADRVNYSKLTRVMASLLHHTSVPVAEIASIDVGLRSELFESCLQSLARTLAEKRDNKRHNLRDMSYSSLYSLIVNSAKK
ncbi:hypothetical protein AC1031_012262 [Aphanomyces cochlioides]|nr:hypothetical protein AC1031_012262 [Aphanomyces cochlioides]